MSTSKSAKDSSYTQSLSPLKFALLREANIRRLPQFKDAEGNTAHAAVDGSDWSPDRWLNAMVGEVGELAGELKKAGRGDYGLDAKRAMNYRHNEPDSEGNLHPLYIPSSVLDKIAKELADIVIYADLFAHQFRLDLGAAILHKFNEVTDRVKADVKIDVTGNTLKIDSPEEKVEKMPYCELRSWALIPDPYTEVFSQRPKCRIVADWWRNHPQHPDGCAATHGTMRTTPVLTYALNDTGMIAATKNTVYFLPYGHAAMGNLDWERLAGLIPTELLTKFVPVPSLPLPAPNSAPAPVAQPSPFAPSANK